MRILPLLALGMLALVDTPVQAQGKKPGGEENAARFGWLSNLEEGKALARKTGKPLMVVFRCVP
jgi:hypothetical protein